MRRVWKELEDDEDGQRCDDEDGDEFEPNIVIQALLAAASRYMTQNILIFFFLCTVCSKELKSGIKSRPALIVLQKLITEI